MGETKKISFEYTVNSNWDELDEATRKLLRDAAQAATKAYAPYSKFRVGAAIRLTNGRLITGNNQENASFPAGCCAERVALHAALSVDPEAELESIAIVAPSMPDKLIVTPCGVCRQALLEQQSRQSSAFTIIMGSPGGEVILVDSANHLLPLAFIGDFLGR